MPPRALVFYSLGAALCFAGAFMAMLTQVPEAKIDPATEKWEPDATLFALTTVLMFLAGALGGTLYNLRGLNKHAALGDFDPRHTLNYYLRPISGGISGLIVFFLLLGGALAFNVGGDVQKPGWTHLEGRMPFIAFSLLAGYASQEFMLKVKDVAGAMFSLSPKPDKERPQAARQPGDTGAE